MTSQKKVDGKPQKALSAMSEELHPTEESQIAVRSNFSTPISELVHAIAKYPLTGDAC
jgi:hypothetical protein